MKDNNAKTPTREYLIGVYISNEFYLFLAFKRSFSNH